MVITSFIITSFIIPIITNMLYSQYCLGASSQHVQPYRTSASHLFFFKFFKFFKALDLTAVWEARNCYSSPATKGLKHREIKDLNHYKLDIVWYSYLGFPNSYEKKLTLPKDGSPIALNTSGLQWMSLEKLFLHWLLRQESSRWYKSHPKQRVQNHARYLQQNREINTALSCLRKTL